MAALSDDSEAEWIPDEKVARTLHGYDPRVHCYAHMVLHGQLHEVGATVYDEDLRQETDSRESVCVPCLKKTRRIGGGAMYDANHMVASRARSVAAAHTRGPVWDAGEQRIRDAAMALQAARQRRQAYAEDDPRVIRHLEAEVARAHDGLRQVGLEVTRRREMFTAWDEEQKKRVRRRDPCYACGGPSMYYMVTCSSHYEKLVSHKVDDLSRHEPMIDVIRRQANRERAAARAAERANRTGARFVRM